jgi:hypothetical protein
VSAPVANRERGIRRTRKKDQDKKDNRRTHTRYGVVHVQRCQCVDDGKFTTNRPADRWHAGA